MKYLKKFEALGTLKKDDMEALSDIFLEFNEKWELEVHLNQKGMGDNICEIQRFDRFSIYIKIKKTDQNREFRSDLQNVINRVQKFGYEVMPSDINSASFGASRPKINADGSLKDPYYFFSISHTEEKSKEILKESFWKKKNKDDEEYDRIFRKDILKMNYKDEVPTGHRPLMQDEINDIKDLFLEYEEKWTSEHLISTLELTWNEDNVDKGEISIEIPIEVPKEFKIIYKDLRPYIARLKSFGFTTEEGKRNRRDGEKIYTPYYYIDIYSICD